jgi:hypothetical protein
MQLIHCIRGELHAVNAYFDSSVTVAGGFFQPGNYTWSVTGTDGELSTSTAPKFFYVRSATDVKEIPNVANSYRLEQNYPNPFNPETKIQFSVKKSGPVRLMVYDPLGKTLDILVDQNLRPGSYEASFDASKYSSGVMFYSLQSKDGIVTKKMLLVK